MRANFSAVLHEFSTPLLFLGFAAHKHPKARKGARAPCLFVTTISHSEHGTHRAKKMCVLVTK